MEEVKVNVAVLKNAIQRVAINDFNQELVKITSVADLTQEEWSELVSDAKKKIDKCILFTKDEDTIFRLLLKKLISLSSEREKLSLTHEAFNACKTLLIQPRFLMLNDELKNPKGYCLRYFLYDRGPTGALYQKDQDEGSVGQEKITKFKEGHISFSKLWSVVWYEGGRENIDLVCFKFLVSEFGEDFPVLCFHGFKLSYYPLSQAFEVIKENRVLLNECYKSYFGSLVYSDVFKRVSDHLEVIFSHMKIFSLLLNYGVNHFQIRLNGKNLREVVAGLKKYLQDNEAFLQDKDWFVELKTVIQELDKKIDAGLIAALGIYRYRYFAYPDVRNLVSQAIQTEIRNSPTLTASKPG